ncbi:MAG: hypothetical protein OHK0048_16190 [Rhodoferax sp.]
MLLSESRHRFWLEHLSAWPDRELAADVVNPDLDQTPETCRCGRWLSQVQASGLRLAAAPEFLRLEQAHLEVHERAAAWRQAHADGCAAPESTSAAEREWACRQALIQAHQAVLDAIADCRRVSARWRLDRMPGGPTP